MSVNDAHRDTGAVPRISPVRVADVAGVIEAVGQGTTTFARGDRVFGQLAIPRGLFGPHANEFIVAEDAPVAHIPPGLDPTAAAALPTAAATALDLVDSLEPLAGRTVAIAGGGDGIGSFATQFAANAGAHVITQVHASAAAQMRAYGAAETVGDSFADLINTVTTAHPEGIDVLIDVASDPATFDDLAVLLVRPTWGTAVTTRNVADPYALATAGIIGVNHTPKISAGLLRRVGEAIVSRRVFAPPIAGAQLASAA